jgi:hypothetical protein
VRFRLQATDPEGDPILYKSDGAPDGSSFYDNIFYWQTQAGDAGFYRFALTAFDSCAATQEVEVKVMAPPPPGTQRDLDQDGVGDLADNCPSIPNIKQEDRDSDGIGDACARDGPPSQGTTLAERRMVQPPPDQDQDGVEDLADNCATVPNVSQADLDRDTFGDACDADPDGDGYLEAAHCGSAEGCPLPGRRSPSTQTPALAAGVEAFLPPGGLVVGGLLFLVILALSLLAVARRQARR